MYFYQDLNFENSNTIHLFNYCISLNLFFLINIGDGAYSNVFRVKRLEDGELYALKKVKLDHLSEKERENAINEVRILASIKH